MRKRAIPALCLTMGLVAAACGGDSVLGEPTATVASTSVTTLSDPDTTSSTSFAPSSTTSPPPTSSTTTTSPAEGLPLFDVIESVESPAEAAGVEPGGRLGGAPDAATAETLTTELQQAGFDPIGMTIWVWPVSGSPEVLLILDVTDGITASAPTRRRPMPCSPPSTCRPPWRRQG